jgi:hypothetical protein
VRTERALLRAWYGGLLAGLLPILVLGFLYSALADRLAFAGWALAAATAWLLLLRYGLSTGWEAPRLAGAMALLAALGFGAFAWLEQRHHEILDLGFRAVLPGVYHPAATRPATAGVLAAALAASGLGALLLRRKGS